MPCYVKLIARNPRREASTDTNTLGARPQRSPSSPKEAAFCQITKYESCFLGLPRYESADLLSCGWDTFFCPWQLMMRVTFDVAVMLLAPPPQYLMLNVCHGVCCILLWAFLGQRGGGSEVLFENHE